MVDNDGGNAWILISTEARAPRRVRYNQPFAATAIIDGLLQRSLLTFSAHRTCQAPSWISVRDYSPVDTCWGRHEPASKRRPNARKQIVYWTAHFHTKMTTLFCSVKVFHDSACRRKALRQIGRLVNSPVLGSVDLDWNAAQSFCARGPASTIQKLIQSWSQTFDNNDWFSLKRLISVLKSNFGSTTYWGTPKMMIREQFRALDNETAVQKDRTKCVGTI